MVPEEGFLSPNYNSSGDEMGSSTCEHVLESKNENEKEPEKKKKEQYQLKNPLGKLNLKTESLATLLPSLKLESPAQL